MKTETASPPGFWRAVWLLLNVSRKRATGRRQRAQELLHNRTKNSSTDWSVFGFGFAFLFMAVINICAAFVVNSAVASGEKFETERQGKIVVSQRFIAAVKSAEINVRGSNVRVEELVPAAAYVNEAERLVRSYGGSEEEIEKTLRDGVRLHGAQGLVTSAQASPGLIALPRAGAFTAMLGSITLLWWGVMLVFQGDGLELELQRRRHPMWEWVFSHPVPAGAVFMAEMLSPIAANPIYWSAPLFVAFIYGFVYGPWLGALAAVLVGVPVTVAAACLGKALEIAAILRFSPRSRGAVIGFMSWLGYATMMLLLLGSFTLPKILTATEKQLTTFVILPWPWLRLFLGGRADGFFSYASGILFCWLVAAITIAGATRFSVWGAQQGLSGNFAAGMGPGVARKREIKFGREPLYRKEFLWFIRDRSAIVQTILIPLTVAGFQAFNLRGVLANAQGAWNYLCGAAILFGTYFLWVLGPKSLASEGAALWISMTWPRGLENLLKAKAWLWSLLSSALVALVLCYAAYLFPREIWKIALAGVGWFVFGRSMAEKSVTLVTVTSSSGEVERVPRGRRWAAQLGMVTFSIGILTQQWHVAIMGIVYSYMTAAAMWQNFRARLPYLYDPWSERLPPPPTLMHAMIAISSLVEGGAVVAAIVLVAAGREHLALARAMSYALCAVLVSTVVTKFLLNRGVKPQKVWTWPTRDRHDDSSDAWWLGYARLNRQLMLSMLAAICGGILLALFAHEYFAILSHLSATVESIRNLQEQAANVPELRLSYEVMAVLFAPFAEEYLFRGLLYRALDREWGGWRAVFASAAFFAVYHAPLSWLPVGLLGVSNAILFKKTGRLAPAVVLHMVYNAVMLR
jgi:membrane protease YdiL (CAAX protease family)